VNSPPSISRQEPVKSEPGKRRLFYGLETRQLVSGLPPLAGTHDAAFYRWINQTGLVKAWEFFIHRMTAGGRWFSGATLAFFLFAAGSTLETQSYVPFCYAAALWVLALLMMWWFRPRVQLQVRHAERICVGETLPIELGLTNIGRLGLYEARVLPHRLPPPFEAVPSSGVALETLSPGAKTQAKLGVRALRRGAYNLRGVRVETAFPLDCCTLCRKAVNNARCWFIRSSRRYGA
jgi:hypothetical protein